MLETFIHKITPNYTTLKNRTVYLILFLVALCIRLPFFFRDYIDYDESTFILIGQSWADGHLPYTELWDIKPPITFLFFASTIYAFGKSFFAIRFFGTVIVAVTAFFSYKIGVAISTKKIGLWSAVGCVLLQSMFGSIQGVMSEHIGMFFFMPAVYLLIKYKKWYWYTIAGLLMGLSLMTKLNLAYAVLFLGLYILFEAIRKKEYIKGLGNAIAFGIGIIVIILLTILPYYLEGITELWWKSVIQAPLEYTGTRRKSFLKMAPTFLFIFGFFFFAWKRQYLNFKDTRVQILLVTVIGVLLSFIKGGRLNSHYLIQLYPAFIVLVGVVISKIEMVKRFNYKPYVFFLALLLPAESYLEYYRIVKNKIERGTFYNGEGITVPNYLVKNNIDTENILFLTYHIGYWVLDAKPPTKAATHPSNICKSEMFSAYDNTRKTGLEEIRFIMEDIKPKVVVFRKDRSLFDEKMADENKYLNAYLEQHYKPIHTVDEAEIYGRLEGF